MKSHHFFLCKMQHTFFQSSDFGGISLHCDRRREMILTFFFRVILPLSRQTYLRTTQFAYCFQALKLNLGEYLRFTNCYGKANKKHIS